MNSSGKTSIEISVEKEDGVAQASVKTKGSLTSEQTERIEELKMELMALVNAASDEDAEIEVVIEHEAKGAAGEKGILHAAEQGEGKKVGLLAKIRALFGVNA